MKKITLLLSILLIWGCSQAQDQASTTDAVKDQAKTAVTKQVDAVKAEATEKAIAVASQTADYQAGIHYQVISPAYDTNSKDAVIVYEFFGYTCPHCATFEPYMNKLQSQLPDNAKIVRVPVVFGKQWEPFAQAYYTFEAMGITDQAHGPMFSAIHQHRKQFRSIEEIAAWAASSFGVDKDKFLSTAKSFMIDGQVRKGMQMLQAMGVTSTPTLITNGKYAPNNKAFKTRDGVIEVTQYLVAQELNAMGLN